MKLKRLAKKALLELVGCAMVSGCSIAFVIVLAQVAEDAVSVLEDSPVIHEVYR